MKKKTIVTLLAILVLSTLIVHASIGTRTASLLYENIKILLDSREIKPQDATGKEVEPFIIDGTTYLPVRGIASALGLNVGWDDATKTVVLSTPGVFSGGVTVYEDDNVVIEFAGTSTKELAYTDIVYYYANFNIKNKTEKELTFQPDAISFNGISYQLTGSEEVAPMSTGKISFYTTEEVLPLSGINKTSGTVRVIDFEADITDWSYDAKWVNVVK